MGFLSKATRGMFEEKKPDTLKADIRMISGCEDAQTSADVSNVSSFKLPDPAGRAGGACTSTLLNILYKDEHIPEKDYSYVEVLEKMRDDLASGGFTQIPQLTASHPIDVNVKFDLVPTEATGVRRALLIGINYVGHEQGVLSGCHNDVLNMTKYIKQVHGFEDENITIMLDDDSGNYESPTRENIINAYKKLVAESAAGDDIFCHYSGHGCKIRDDEKEEADGFDEALVPVDYTTGGLIRDDDVFDILVKQMPAEVHLLCLFDCCHSGTIMDLPYMFKPGMQEMEIDESFDFEKLLGKVGQIFAGFFD